MLLDFIVQQLKVKPRMAVDLFEVSGAPLLKRFVPTGLLNEFKCLLSAQQASVCPIHTRFLACFRPISSPSKRLPMNIPGLTSASSIRSGQGEIREQTG